MEITNIKIRKMIDEERLKAVVSVTFDDCFCVHDIKLIKTEEHLFLAMPSKKISEGEFKDIVHPIHHEFREKMENAVFKVYNQQNNI